MRRIGGKRVALLGAVLALVVTGSAWAAFQQLPPGDQVNNDAPAGIDPTRAVSVEDPANSDVTGGSLAGGVNVPWSVFRQTTSTGHDQIFSRSFASGHWTTRGAGTVGGISSASPTFSGSLNFDQGRDGEAPSIDFAGTGRAVPWATWYESTVAEAGHEQIFASRFDSSTGKWIFAGQGRTAGSVAPPAVPSLNIHPVHDAENPVVAGGSTANPAAPGPWITWQETDNSTVGPVQGPNQIFVSKPIAGAANCDGVKPAGIKDNPLITGHVPAIGGFCFQQVGIDREPSGADVGTPTTDPSLNVDPSRDGIEPDIAFTGPSDSVPWVVWYETGTSGIGLSGHELVFAAKGVADGSADGGFHWQAVGNTTSGALDTTGLTNHLGICAESTTAENACSLNADPTNDAVDPRVAAGTMTPGNPTVPWVAWQESSGGHQRIFVSRLVNGQFQIANAGQPLPTVVNGIDATRPDITFSGNTPYVSWHEGSTVVYGHFTTPDSFVIDNAPVGANVPNTVRAPISSGCTANPFNADGASCQAGALGTPFFLFTDGATPKLLADAYQTDAPATGAPSAVGSTAAIVTGSVNPQGAPVKVQFQYGPTTAYGQITAAQKLGAANAPVGFAATLTGLSASTPIHYRAIASTDFGTVVGGDRTLTTTATPPPPKDTKKPHLRLTIRKTTIKSLLHTHKLRISVRIDEAAKVRLSASARGHSLGKAGVTFKKAGSKTVSLKLTKSALRRLRHLQRVTIKVTGKATDLAGNTSTKKTSRTIKRR